MSSPKKKFIVIIVAMLSALAFSSVASARDSSGPRLVGPNVIVLRPDATQVSLNLTVTDPWITDSCTLSINGSPFFTFPVTGTADLGIGMGLPASRVSTTTFVINCGAGSDMLAIHIVRTGRL